MDLSTLPLVFLIVSTGPVASFELNKLAIVVTPDELQEVCQNETFSMQCPDGLAIFIGEDFKTEFGRNGNWEQSSVRGSRCGQKGEDASACKTTTYILRTLLNAHECHGHQRCQVPLSYSKNSSAQCPITVKKYMTVLYTCVLAFSDDPKDSENQSLISDHLGYGKYEDRAGSSGAVGASGQRGETGDNGHKGDNYDSYEYDNYDLDYGDENKDNTMKSDDLSEEEDNRQKGDGGVGGQKGERGMVAFSKEVDRGPKAIPGYGGYAGGYGPAGDYGHLGDHSPAGDVGPAGDIGPAGDQGPAGDHGTAGERGSRGPNGTSYDSGSTKRTWSESDATETPITSLINSTTKQITFASKSTAMPSRKPTLEEISFFAQKYTEAFFDGFSSGTIDILGEEAQGKIQDGFEIMQASAKDSPEASLKATEAIGQSVMTQVSVDEDKTVEVELTTKDMNIKLVKKNFATKNPETSTTMTNKDNMMILPDQAELLDHKREMQITMASHYNLQESLGSASDVLTVSANNQKTNLSKPLIFVIPNKGKESVSCAYYDFHLTEWSRKGCETVCHNGSHTMCSCSHLTNFALIFNVHEDSVAMDNSHLDFITYVGFTISIVCMLLTIAVFVSQKVKSERDVIHVNLCISLLTAEVIFLFGISATDDAITCSIIAATLHYFFLAAFAWMLLEGFQIYLMLVRVFDTSSVSPVLRNFSIGYLLPLIIVLVSFVTDHLTLVLPDSFSADMLSLLSSELRSMCPVDHHLYSSYGTTDYCWLRVDNHFILTFIIPAVIVICSNLGFLAFAIYKMIFHKFNGSKKDVNLIVSYIKGVALLIFLLGSTWIFGLLYLAINNIYLAYIFTILNSLQGVGIFVFQCVLNTSIHQCLRESWYSLLVRTGCREGFPEDYSVSQSQSRGTEK